MDYCFGIGLSGKTVSSVLQQIAQLVVIVNLTVEDNGDAAVLVEHRLLTARQIDNSETPHSEASGFVDPFPALIRTSM